MKKKTKILIIVGIMILGGWWFYKHQSDVNFCKEKCKYTPTSKVWLFRLELGYRTFPKQEQCVDYCLMNIDK